MNTTKTIAYQFKDEYKGYFLDEYGRIYSTKSNKYLAAKNKYFYTLYANGKAKAVKSTYCGKMVDFSKAYVIDGTSVYKK